MTNFAFKDMDLLEDPIRSDVIVQSIIRKIKGAKKSLKIYSGEAYWAIFDHPEMLGALRRIGKNGVTIQIVVGPVLSCGGAPSSPEIASLAKEEIAEFYYRPKRGRYPHFILIDDRIALVEEEHIPWLPSYERRFKRIQGGRGSEEFKRHQCEFNSYIRSDNLISEPKRGYILLRNFEIKKVFETANQRGKDYNNLTRAEIENIISVARAHMAQIKKRFAKATAL